MTDPRTVFSPQTPEGSTHDPEDVSSNPRVSKGAPTIGDVISARYSRRGFGLGLLGTTAIAGLGGFARAPRSAAPRAQFDEIVHGTDETHHLAAGHEADVLIRWGDPLFSDAPVFDPLAQSAAAQARQFGYNNDYIGYVPLDPGADGAERALLCVNHEYTSTPLMFPGVPRSREMLDAVTAEMADTELAAHGGTVMEIARQSGGAWSVVVDGALNRRIMGTTPMEATGPAAGSDRLKTSADPTGRLILGTINNCAGGTTPWGTYLMAEENFNLNFLGSVSDGHAEARNHARYGVPGGRYAWGRYHDRFDVSKEPNEPNRFGWVVEVDPLDPEAAPKKRTALGRFKHEGAESVVNKDGRVVLYMGDDQRFDYVYKFVTAGAYNAGNRAANRDLLDEGILYVARFNPAGTVDWLPLVFGEGPLTPENGFESQADVVIEARRAGDLLGATPMDRPEDVEPAPKTGKVYVMLTNNSERTADQVDAANPRAENLFGHVIEIIEPEGDFAALQSRWEIVVRAGDPAKAEVGAQWHPQTSAAGWFASPDNCAVDALGRLWVATDGAENAGTSDGLWALETEGELRGLGQMFFRAPAGAEVCGPIFTPDARTLFLAVQHPGDGSGATFATPKTRWPDFQDGRPPRPSVLAITKSDGGVIAG